MAVFKKLAMTAASAVALAGALGALAASPAHAASYNGACGSGYSPIDSHDIVGGTIHLTYNASNGYNCVVTIRNSPGTALYMNAYLTASDGRQALDQGYYTTYAGPVKLYAPGQCVSWAGGIDIGNDNYWYSPWSHCS